jgi:hypothetical protein
MRNLYSRIGLLIGLVALSASLAFAAPGKNKAKKAAPLCPVCKMVLSTKKTKKTPNAVRVGKKTYYCCGCDMSKYKDKKGHIVLPSK